MSGQPDPGVRREDSVSDSGLMKMVSVKMVSVKMVSVKMVLVRVMLVVIVV